MICTNCNSRTWHLYVPTVCPHSLCINCFAAHQAQVYAFRATMACQPCRQCGLLLRQVNIIPSSVRGGKLSVQRQSVISRRNNNFSKSHIQFLTKLNDAFSLRIYVAYLQDMIGQLRGQVNQANITRQKLEDECRSLKGQIDALRDQLQTVKNRQGQILAQSYQQEKMPISLDKIEAQRQNLIEKQIIKAEKACMKIDNNFRILMNSIPPALLDQNVGALLKALNHDLNAAIANQHQKMTNQNNVHSKASKTTQLDDEKIESNTWDTKIQKSPPKLFPQKRIIKNLKKK